MPNQSLARPVLSDLQKARRFLSAVLPIVRSKYKTALSFQLLGFCQNTKLLRGPNVQSWDPSDICDQYLSKPLLQELPLLWPSLCRLCLLHQCHHTLCLVDCIFDMVLDRYIKS